MTLKWDLLDIYHEEFLPIWRMVIPHPTDRIPVTSRTVHHVFLPLLPLVLMGYLVRRPNTQVYRLAMLPYTIWTILRASFAYSWVDQLYSPYNFGQGGYHKFRCLEGMTWIDSFAGIGSFSSSLFYLPCIIFVFRFLLSDDFGQCF